MTRGRAVRAAAARLAEAEVETPELDARLLALAAFGIDLPRLISTADHAATAEAAARLDGFVRRRALGEPVARILGRREFWGLDFALGPDTLDPRPDTETVVEAALAAVGPGGRAPKILDLGTGSGCILIALLSEVPNATGVGVDRSFGAAQAARANAGRLGLGRRAAFVVGDWAAALSARFDLVVSNPPYISRGDIGGLPVDVRAHDPALALDGGPDGLDAYRAIAAALPALVAPGGAVVLELGQRQETDVVALLRRAGFAVDGPARTDLGGVPRALTARPVASAGM